MALVETQMVSTQQVFLPYAAMPDGRTLAEHVETNPSMLLGEGKQSQSPAIPPIGKQRQSAQHCTQFWPLLVVQLGAGGVMVMSDKILDRPVALLLSMGAVFLMLWIVIDYDPEGISAESVPQQHAGRMR